MELKKEKRFKDLKKRYAYEIAMHKQAVDGISEEDLYNSLLILEFQDRVELMLDEITAAWEMTESSSDSEVLECITALFAKSIHEITEQLSLDDSSHGVRLKHMAHEVISNGLGEE